LSESVTALVVRRFIDDTWKAGSSPYLSVDATLHDVKGVPPRVRAKHRSELFIELRQEWPMNLIISRTGITADLAFDGLTVRCSFPFSSIAAVLDKRSLRGISVTALQNIEKKS
jgi:stringent starvation protein B